MSWKRLAWDSEQFGFPAARLEFANGAVASHGNARLGEILDECRHAGIRHLVTRVDAGALAAIRALERAGFEMLDGIQTLALRLDGQVWDESSPDFIVRLCRTEDRACILGIARRSYIYDRFHADTALAPGVADRVNETWVDNCCRGLMADAVFVAQESGAILGFVTCSVDRERSVGTIGMVAVDDAARRRGIARVVTGKVLHWLRAQGVRQVEVGTQLANIPATRLYQSFGFRTTTVSMTFRKML